MSGISKLDLARLNATDILYRLVCIVKDLGIDEEFIVEVPMYACSFKVVGLDGYVILKDCIYFYSKSLKSLKEKLNKLGEATANNTSILSIRLKDTKFERGNVKYYEILIQTNYI